MVLALLYALHHVYKLYEVNLNCSFVWLLMKKSCIYWLQWQKQRFFGRTDVMDD